jgi:phage-related protein
MEMKTAEHKTTSATNATSQVQPFFNKGGSAMHSNEKTPFFSPGHTGIQTKLTVGQPNDKYEKEADAMADKVVQRLSSGDSVHTKPILQNGYLPFIQAKCTECEKEDKLQKKEEPKKELEEKKLQRKPIFESLADTHEEAENVQRKCTDCEKEEKLQKKETPGSNQTSIQNIEGRLNSTKGSGSPLDPGIQSRMESSFGTDFSSVRIHNNSTAVQLSEDMHAQAFTHKNDIYFNSGKYDIQAPGGQHLLAHELTHTIQQGNAPLINVQHKLAHSIPGVSSGKLPEPNGGKNVKGNTIATNNSTNNTVSFSSSENFSIQTKPASGEKDEKLEKVEEDKKDEKKLQKKNKPHIAPNYSTLSNNSLHAFLSSPQESIQPKGVLDNITGAAGAAWNATGGKVVSAATDLILDQIRSLSPKMVAFIEEIRKVGVVNYFKSKLMQAVNGIFDGLQNNSGMINAIFPKFGVMVVRARVIVNALAAGDCKPLFAAVNELKEIVSTLAGEAWDAIVEFFQPAIDFFSEIWNSFALPAIEWLKQKAASVWNWIKEIGSQIWEWYRPLREAIGQAWDYIKGIIGLNADETGEEGLIQWAQRKAGEVWEAIKEELKPIIEPAKAMVARIKEIIPLTAILNLRKTIQDWLKKVIDTSTSMGDDASNVGNEAAQTSLRDQILPAIQQSIEKFRGSISDASAWVNGKIGEVFVTVSQFFASVRSISLISFATGIIGWVETKVSELNDWIQSKVSALFDMVSEGLHNLGEFLRPVYDTLKKILDILGDILGKLPEFLMGPLWWILPDCIKDPIKKFFLEQILSRMSFFQKLQKLENIWERLEAAAITILKQIFIDGNLRKAIWTFFSTMLDILGLPPQLVTRVIGKAAKSLSDILNDPLGFLSNFIRALKLGFEQFYNKIGTHLLSGLQAWLFSKLEGTGIEMPKDFSFRSMLKLAFDILGITVDMLLTKLEEVTGKKGLKQKIEKVIGVISKAWDWFEKLMDQSEEGGTVWDKLEKAIGSIWDMILDGVVGWLEKTIVVKALAWVAEKLDPTGIMAVITTIIDVFNVLGAIMDKAREILEMIEKVLDDIASLILGVIGAAADILERAMAAAIPVVLAIISALFGLDDVVDQIKEVIKNLRKKVEDGVKKVMEGIKSFIERLFGTNNDKDTGKNNGLEDFNYTKENIAMDQATHSVTVKSEAGVISIIIRSDEVDLKIAAKNAKSEMIEKISAEKNPKNIEDYKLVISALTAIISQIDDLGSTIKVELAKNKSSQGKTTPQLEKEITAIEVSKIETYLKNIGRISGADSLQELVNKKIPTRRFLPIKGTPSSYIRGLFYEGMFSTEWKNTKDTIKKEKWDDIGIPARIENAKIKKDMIEWAGLIRDEFIDFDADIFTYDYKKAAYAVDHDTPIASYWNNPGNNKGDDVRKDQLLNKNNLRYITKRNNSRKGSGGVNYDEFVLPDFDSSIAEAGKKEAKTVKGDAFLDEKKVPI